MGKSPVKTSRSGRWALACAVAATLAAGCGGGDGVESQPLPATDVTSVGEELTVAPQVEEPAAGVTAWADYEFPYPYRETIFQAPRDVGYATAVATPVMMPGEVELKGFISVDVPKAILKRSGELAWVSAGDAVWGIEIVSIAPPEVTLRQDDEEWTLGLLGTRATGAGDGRSQGADSNEVSASESAHVDAR